MQPDSLFDKHESDHAFNPVAHLHKGVDGDNGQRRVTAQYESDRHADTPDKDTVEKESDNRLAAGAQRKVGGVQKGVLRHENGGKHNEVCRQRSRFLVCVVKQREKLR